MKPLDERVTEAYDRFVVIAEINRTESAALAGLLRRLLIQRTGSNGPVVVAIAALLPELIATMPADERRASLETLDETVTELVISE